MRVPAILFAAIMIVLGAVNCSKKDNATTDKAQKPQVLTAIPTVNSDDQVALKASEKLTEQFSTNLEQELDRAVSENGPAGAINVCGATATALKQSLMGGGWTIKRVSQRYRNVDNKADTLESQILGQFARDTTKKYQATWEFQGQNKLYVYYKPIYVNKLCLNCHGDPQAMDPKVVSALASKYPSDQALGYKEGDLRGMLIVTGLWPIAKARAEELAK